MVRDGLLVAALVLGLPPILTAQVQPRNLPINTAADEDEPHLSSNGLTLYYASHDGKSFNILAATRRDVSRPWGKGRGLDDYVNTDADDQSCFATPDGRYPQFFYYATKKDADTDNFDLYVAQRIDGTRPFSAPTPLNTLSTPDDELHPWLTTDGRTLYFSRKTRDGWRVLTTSRERATGAAGFGKVTLIEELPPGFHHATLTSDGQTMYLQGPLEGGRWGLFRATHGPGGWGKPVPLTMLNSKDAPTGNRSPSLSRNGQFLYFASDRPGGQGKRDIWVVDVADLKDRPAR